MSARQPETMPTPPRWFEGRTRDCDDCGGDGCRTCGGLGFIPGALVGWREDYEAARRDAADAEEQRT